MTGASLLLTGGGDWERYTFAGACNEPVPSNWRNACRRRAGHSGPHHYWDPRTGTDKGRHPTPFSGPNFERIPTVYSWPGRRHDTQMLRGHGAYVAPATTDRLIVEATKSRERALGAGSAAEGPGPGTRRIGQWIRARA